RAFKSDVDFVIDPVSLVEFDRSLQAAGGRTNRFGGYSLSLGVWKADVWALPRTWAAVAGHRPVRRFEDLRGITYFNWDAVIYTLDDHRIIASERYFDDVRERILEVNLAPNPNRLGNALRALRYAWRWEAYF